MIIHNNIIQGSPEWNQLRQGRFGSTSADAFLVGGDKIGKGLNTLIEKIVVAKHYFDDLGEGFKSDAMDRGNDLEPLARELYEEETFTQVGEVGYISKGDYIGYSPDGMIGNDGLIEIKCPLGLAHLRYRLSNEIPKNYYAQMQWGMWVTGRKWCDFIVFHPDSPLLIQRVEPDTEMHELFDAKSKLAIERIKEIEEKIK